MSKRFHSDRRRTRRSKALTLAKKASRRFKAMIKAQTWGLHRGLRAERREEI